MEKRSTGASSFGGSLNLKPLPDSGKPPDDLGRLQPAMPDKDYAVAIEELLAQFHLADALPQMIWSDVGNGTLDYINRRWYDVTGIPYGTTNGDNWIEPIHPDDRQRVWDECQISRLTDGPHQSELRLRYRSGDYRWCLMRSEALRDDARQPYRWFGTITDIHELKEAQEARELLAREFSHRVKNMFALISALASSSARDHPEAMDFVEKLQGRIAALSKAHDVVAQNQESALKSPTSETLFALIRHLLEPWIGTGGALLSLDGYDPIIGQKAAMAFALILHEQATNAVKYGALSCPEGRLAIRCERYGENCLLTWREIGGPPLQGVPEHEGFGTTIVARIASAQLGGKITHEWIEAGLVARLSVTASFLGQ